MFSLTAQQIADLRLEARHLRVTNALLSKARLAQKSRAERLEKENKVVKQKNRKLKEELKKVQEELEKVKRQRDTYKGMVFKPKVISETPDQTGIAKKLGG